MAMTMTMAHKGIPIKAKKYTCNATIWNLKLIFIFIYIYDSNIFCGQLFCFSSRVCFDIMMGVWVINYLMCEYDVWGVTVRRYSDVRSIGIVSESTTESPLLC